MCTLWAIGCKVLLKIDWELIVCWIKPSFAALSIDRLPLRFNLQVLPKRLWDWLSVRCAIRDLYRQVLITVWLRTKFCWGLCRRVAEDFIYCPSKAKVYEAVCGGVAWEFNIGLQKWSLMRLFVAAGWCGCHSKEALEAPYESFLTY